MAEKNLLYIANILISRQIYTCNLLSSMKRDLLYISNIISRQVYARNFKSYIKKDFLYIKSLPKVWNLSSCQIAYLIPLISSEKQNFFDKTNK